MRWRGLKSIMLVELLGLLVKSMHEKCPYAHVLRYSHCTVNPVLEQCGSQVQPLRPAIDRQPGENHDRNRIRHVTANAACRQLMRNGAGRHGVVAADATILIGDYKSTARSG